MGLEMGVVKIKESRMEEKHHNVEHHDPPKLNLQDQSTP